MVKKTLKNFRITLGYEYESSWLDGMPPEHLDVARRVVQSRINFDFDAVYREPAEAAAAIDNRATLARIDSDVSEAIRFASDEVATRSEGRFGVAQPPGSTTKACRKNLQTGEHENCLAASLADDAGQPVHVPVEVDGATYEVPIVAYVSWDCSFEPIHA